MNAGIKRCIVPHAQLTQVAPYHFGALRLAIRCGRTSNAWNHIQHPTSVTCSSSSTKSFWPVLNTG